MEAPKTVKESSGFIEMVNNYCSGLIEHTSLIH